MTARPLLKVALCALLCVGAIALCAAPAAAQEPSFSCNGPRVIEGSPAWLLAASARRSHAQRYGAVETLEREVLVRLRELEGDEVYAMHYGTENLFGALRLPAQAAGDFDCPGGYGLYDYDLNAFNLAIGARFNRLRLFYAASGNAGYLVSDAALRYIQWLIVTGASGIYALGAPLFGTVDTSDEDPVQAVALDYVVGAGLDLTLLDVEVGYVGSSNFFGSVTQRDIALYGRTLFNVEGLLREASLLEGGFNTLSWLVGDHPLGVTSLYGRRFQYTSVGQLVGESGLGDAPYKTVDFWTAHVSQRNIFETFDITASYALTPEPVFHELRLAYHEDDFHKDPYATRRGYGREDWSYGVHVGFVEFPEMRYYGIEGGKRWTAGGELIMVSKTSDFDQLVTRLVLSTNDAHTLDIFPYAANAWRFHASFTGAID